MYNSAEAKFIEAVEAFRIAVWAAQEAGVDVYAEGVHEYLDELVNESITEEDDGQPTEQEEWASFDPDC